MGIGLCNCSDHGFNACFFNLECIKEMILIFILVLIAGIANGLADRIKFHDPFPNSKFWSAGSWINVYKNNNPADGERFIGSTSFLSFLCDGWHLLKTIWIECLCISIAVAFGEAWFYFAVRLIFYIGFESGYK